MIVKNGLVLNSETWAFEKKDLYVENGYIVDHEPADKTVVDAQGAHVIPGFIDSHIHGYLGAAFDFPDHHLAACRMALAAQGTTGYASTIRCWPKEQLMDSIRENVKAMKTPLPGARFYAIHCECPFISPDCSGAMTAPDMECTVENTKELLDAGEGYIKIMTIAPERENALEVIAAFRDQVHFSAGHTLATFEQTTAALAAGATRSTHTFNAMRPLYHRETGVLGAVLTDDRATCEMIADFVHLDPAACKIIYKMKGADKICMVSDTGEMGGCPDGEYMVNGKLRIVKDGVCKNLDGRIAGSCFTLLKGVQNLRSIGIPLEEISRMASYNPAKFLGVSDVAGSLAPGKYADFILCDDTANIAAVYVGGKKIEA